MEHLDMSKEIHLPPQFSDASPEEYLQSLIGFFERYRHLTDLHVVDFMTNNQWDLLDPEWQKALLPTADDSTDEWSSVLVQLAACNTSLSNWPPSLKEYIQAAHNLSLSRCPSDDFPSPSCPIDKHILPGMTEKKIHEVERMNALIEQIARKQHVASVVDLGAGQGYLSRALAYQHRLKVLAVDSSEVQTCGAKKFNAKAMKGGKAFDLHHVTDTIGPENASNILSRWSTHSDEHWLLCGLHACGDLSSLMLQLFAESEEMVALVSVGCCYHFLTEEGEHNGFPMSRALKSTDYRLGSTARMLACQAPSRWLDKKDDSLKAYEHHFFRALLQLIMVEKELAKASAAPVIGRLNKKKDFTSFPVYVKAALARLNIPEDSITQEEASRYYQEYKEKQVDKQMAIFWTIRALLAPVLESIVLMDRWLYLKESLNPLQSATKGVWMWPLFDPIISPRNMVIVATK